MFFSLIIVLCYPIFGQDKKNVSSDSIITAPVNVSVMNMKKVIQKGEQVLFISQKNSRQFSGRSDANGKFSIQLKNADVENAKLSIINNTGMVVRIFNASELKDEASSISINISDLASGIYFIRMETGGNLFTERIVLTK